MESNRNTTRGAHTTSTTFTQGTAGERRATTPFTLAAASGAARRMREQQRALKDTLNSSAKTVREREAEKKKKQEEEAKAKAEAKAAEEEARKREAWAKKSGKSVEDLTTDDLMEMDMSEDLEDDESGDLGDVARNLEMEGEGTGSPMRKRRSVEVTPVTTGGAGGALRMSSFIPHTYRHKRVILDALVRLGAAQDRDRFEEFLGQIKTLLTNGKIVDKYFVINLVIIGDGKKGLRDTKDVPTNMTTLGVP
jgi:hypothetical protein